MSKGKIKFQMLDSEVLTCGAEYQRKINAHKVATIISNFEPHKVNPIKVSYRGGNYWVYDGQHTLAALKALNNGENLPVWCEIHTGLTYHEEARLFAEQDDGITKVSFRDKFHSLIEAKDPNALEMKNVVESLGLELSNTSRGKNKIVAISTIQKIYNNAGTEELKNTLSLVKDTWNGIQESLSAETLMSVYLFLKIYDKEYNKQTFMKHLSNISPLQIKRDGQSDFSVKGNMRYAKQVWKQYNHNLRDKNKLEYKFKE